MPPFGKRWFRVFRELEYDNPVAHLRFHWILLNLHEDRRLDSERRLNDVEYGGFFANPEVYAKLKGIIGKDGPSGPTAANPFGFAIDETLFWKKREAALRGQAMVNPRRADIAELVKQKRDALSREQRPARREREYQPLDDDDALMMGGGDTLEERLDLGIESDDLIIEG